MISNPLPSLHASGGGLFLSGHREKKPGRWPGGLWQARERIILLEAISVDADGNTLTRTNQQTNEVTTYQWDDFNKLVRVSSAISGVPTSTVKESNRYDVNGIRKRKVDKNGNSSVEYTAGISTSTATPGSGTSAAPSISYLMGHQLMGAEVNGNFQFFLTDHVATVRDVVDDTGAVIRSMEFQEHGQLLNSSGSGTISPKTYQGGLSVNDDTADSGLYLMGHRHFESALLGRFISRDPIDFAGGLNLFNGAGTNPVGAVDPSGLQTRAPSAPPVAPVRINIGIIFVPEMIPIPVNGNGPQVLGPRVPYNDAYMYDGSDIEAWNWYRAGAGLDNSNSSPYPPGYNPYYRPGMLGGPNAQMGPINAARSRDNEYVRMVRGMFGGGTELDRQKQCDYLAELLRDCMNNSSERLKITAAQKALGCRNKKKRQGATYGE